MKNYAPLTQKHIFHISKLYAKDSRVRVRLIKLIVSLYGGVINHFRKSWYKCWSKSKFDSEINLSIHQSLLDFVDEYPKDKDLDLTSLMNKHLSAERYQTVVKQKHLDNRSFTYCSETEIRNSGDLQQELENLDLLAKLRAYLLVSFDEQVVDAFFEKGMYGLSNQAVKPKGMNKEYFRDLMISMDDEAKFIASVLRKEWE